MKRYLTYLPWLISAAVIAAAVVAWGQGQLWEFSNLSLYQLFPLLGLVAFSVMWSQSASAAWARWTGIELPGAYYTVTGYVVLVAILLHPGLLAWQLWRDGLGLPPMSTLNYVGPLAFYALLAMAAWLVFIGYEFHRWFGERSWWKLVGYATDVAMLAILIHSLKLGSNLQFGWFRSLWYLYGATLLVFLVDKYLRKLKVI